MERHTRLSGGTAFEDDPTEDVWDRKFGNHLNSYTMQSSQLFDLQARSKFLVPARPKTSWQNVLSTPGRKGIIAVETVEKMTDRQVAARVRERFPR